jgi:hypothetical protein
MKEETTVTAAILIAEARKWLGTSYRNQGRDRDGVDCGGLLLVIGRELGLTELEHLGYSNNPDGETFERLLNENCDPVRDWRHPQPGDILAHDFGEGIQHTSIVTETEPRLKVIHAKRPIGRARERTAAGMRGVIEQYLHGRDERAWVKTYRIRGLID